MEKNKNNMTDRVFFIDRKVMKNYIDLECFREILSFITKKAHHYHRLH